MVAVDGAIYLSICPRVSNSLDSGGYYMYRPQTKFGAR